VLEDQHGIGIVDRREQGRACRIAQMGARLRRIGVGPALAFVLARRWREAALFAVSLAPALVALTLRGA